MKSLHSFIGPYGLSRLSSRTPHAGGDDDSSLRPDAVRDPGSSLSFLGRMALACLVAAGGFASGQLGAGTVVGWDFRGVPTAAVEQREATTVAPGIQTWDAYLSRGPGLRLANLNEGFSAERWTWDPSPTEVDPEIHKFPPTREGAFERGEYYEFRFTVEWNHEAFLSTLDASFRRSSPNSPKYLVWQYSFDNFATPGITIPPAGPIWDSIGWTEQDYFQYLGQNGSADNNVASNYNYMLEVVGNQGGTGVPGNPMPTIDLSGIEDLQGIPAFTTVTFRLYAWSDTDSTTATNTFALGRQDGPVLGGAVVQVGEIPLTIISEIPGTDPAPGAYSHPPGTQITATAPDEVAQDGYVHQLTGWIGTGSVPAEGQGNTVNFTLNEPSTLEWLWEEISSPPDPILQYNMINSPNVTLETFAATTVAEGLTAAPLSRGPGINAVNLTRGFSSNQWSTIPAGVDGREIALSAGDYFEFGFTVASGYTATLASLDHAMRRSAVNAPMFYEWQYSLDGFATPGTTLVPRGSIWEMLEWDTDYFTYFARSATSTPPVGSPDNYNWMKERVDDQNEGNPMPTFDLTQEALLQEIPGGTTVTFRLYGWGNDQTAQTNTIALGRDNAGQIGGPRITGIVVPGDIPPGLAILAVSRVGDTIVLTLDNPAETSFQVERSLDLVNWETVAADQTGSSWSGPIPAGAERAFWRLTP